VTDSARIELRLPSEADWLKVFNPREGTLRVELLAAVELGDTVRVDLVVGGTGPATGGEAPMVVLRGEVISVAPAAEAFAPAAVTLALAASEREKINYLNGFVRGGLLNLRQRRRLPVRVPVTYGGIGGAVDTVSRDLGDDGIFVVTTEPLPEGTKLHMFLRVPGLAQPLPVSGVVGHTVVPADGDVPGMGVTFVLDDDSQAALAAVLDALERGLRDGTLPASMLG
jgi:uncharacterized protein (TIGR02266 family)